MPIEVMNLIMRTTVNGENQTPDSAGEDSKSENANGEASGGSGGGGGGGLDRKAVARMISEALKNSKER